MYSVVTIWQTLMQKNALKRCTKTEQTGNWFRGFLPKR